MSVQNELISFGFKKLHKLKTKEVLKVAQKLSRHVVLQLELKNCKESSIQFHQHFKSSFCANFFSPKNYTFQFSKSRSFLCVERNLICKSKSMYKKCPL